MAREAGHAVQIASKTGKEVDMDTCANCGMSKQQWKANNGQGYTKNGQTYCCRGCAEGGACTCR